MANEKVKKRCAAKSGRQPHAKDDCAIDAKANATIEAMAKEFRAARASPFASLIKVENDGGKQRIGPAHADPLVGEFLLKDATGASDFMFRDAILNQLARSASEGGKIDEGKLNFTLSVVRSTKPKDQLEAMLAAQMAVVHLAMMGMAPILANINEIPQLDSVGRAFNNLARTFATQMEALKRYRSGGEQKVTVQHVSVSDGGQAIVGNVTQSAHGKASDTPSNSPSPPPALAPPSQAPMASPIDFKRQPTPVRRKAR